MEIKYFFLFIVCIEITNIFLNIDNSNSSSKNFNHKNTIRILIDTTNATSSSTNSTKSIDFNELQGSFFYNAKLYETPLPNDAKLKFSFVLSVPGVSRPDNLLTGSFLDENDNLDEEKGTDVFKTFWSNPVDTIFDEGMKESENQKKNIISLYKLKLQLLTLTNKKEIVFLYANDNKGLLINIHSLNLDKLAKLLYRDKIVTENESFTFENYNKLNYYNQDSPLDANPEPIKLASFDGLYQNQKFGFSFADTCKKFKSLSTNFSMKNPNILYHYQTNFTDIIENWLKNFSFDNYIFRPYKEGIGNITLNKDTLNKNLTLIKDLVNILLADYAQYPNQIDRLNDYIPDRNIQRIYDLKKFIYYETMFYSDLYSYLTISPFFNFLIDEFNKRSMLNRDKTVTALYNNLVYFSVPDHVIYGLYKVLNYDPDKRNTPRYADLPFISYGFTVHFELWKTSKGNDASYYVAIRENYEDTPKYMLTTDNFALLTRIFLMNPDFSENERKYYCGTVINNS